MKTLILSVVLCVFIPNLARAADDAAFKEAEKALKELDKFNAEIRAYHFELDRAHTRAAEAVRLGNAAEFANAQKLQFDTIVDAIEKARVRKMAAFGSNADMYAAEFRKSAESSNGVAEAAKKFLKTRKVPVVLKGKGGKAKYGIAAAAATVGVVLTNGSGAAAAEFKALETPGKDSSVEKRSDVEIGTLDAN